MKCPACGATCASGVTIACDKCGQAFDLDMTGFMPPVPAGRADATNAGGLTTVDATIARGMPFGADMTISAGPTMAGATLTRLAPRHVGASGPLEPRTG